jgi:hypothetical protein
MYPWPTLYALDRFRSSLEPKPSRREPRPDFLYTARCENQNAVALLLHGCLHQFLQQGLPAWTRFSVTTSGVVAAISRAAKSRQNMTPTPLVAPGKWEMITPLPN